MLKIRIAVLVSGGGTNLQALIDAGASGKIPNGEIALVVSNRSGAFALERAKASGIKAVTVKKKKEQTQDEFEKQLLAILSDNNIDLIVLAGFLAIFSADFVRHYQNRIINVHPSLIPSFCGKGFYGLKVHEEVLKYGVKVTGATVHFVNEITDGGKIILQKAVEVEPTDTAETLQRRVMEQAEWVLLPVATQMVCEMITKEQELI